MSHDGFALEVPARSEHLGTARAFAAAVARHYEVDADVVDDLKIAISEACVDALAEAEPLRVRAEDLGRSLRFEVASPRGDARPDEDRADLDELGAPVRLELIRALFDDAAVEDVDGERVVRFTVPLP
jgi:serine/threonine-protein kinase RsbW